MKGILLDLDDTLIDDRSAMRVAFGEFVAAHGIDFNEQHMVAWRRISARHWVRYEAGEIGFLEQRRCRVRDFLGRQMGDDEADAAYVPYAMAYERAWRLVPGADAFLERTRGIPKVIITNGDRSQQLRKVQVCGLAEHVVGIVTPTDCGYWKPHPNIFLAALAMLGMPASDCLMVGDDERRDIEPARSLGMRSFIVESGHETQDISNLSV